ncbi:MAG: hypothetical protein F6K40_36645 [Okeania sp. SIO3I5]|uniref:hypothetical protein n=1 Tax=Okeania sp. SIO3I5 TaxID=2607805 RepID=UPI0013BC866D|nr:hypothetical protein [Okeania sp. SIO3I5]NEQ41431.1 hypothetical protein [Okeania sp. SIO3I5]
MAKITHKEVFALLIKEVLEAYPKVENKLDFVSKDILDHLNSNSDKVRERLRKGSFTKDDGKINQTEAFLLTWVDEVWDVKNGNKELYKKFISDLNGTPQEFDLYDKEVPQINNG